MKTLIIHFALWATGTGLTVLAALSAHVWLHNSRYPHEATVESILRARLHPVTAAQERLIQEAVQRDPIQALVAVSIAQRRDLSPWKEINAKPSALVIVPKMALQAGLDGKIDQATASRFADSTLLVWGILEDASHVEAERFLSSVSRLAPEEFGNQGNDPSYALISSRLDTRFRADFRKNQEILSPLLAVTAPAEWNNLLERFQSATPRQ